MSTHASVQTASGPPRAKSIVKDVAMLAVRGISRVDFREVRADANAEMMPRRALASSLVGRTLSRPARTKLG